MVRSADDHRCGSGSIAGTISSSLIAGGAHARAPSKAEAFVKRGFNPSINRPVDGHPVAERSPIVERPLPANSRKANLASCSGLLSPRSMYLRIINANLRRTCLCGHALADGIECSGHDGYRFGIVGTVELDYMQHHASSLCNSRKVNNGEKDAAGQNCTL
jgi:hypothetical protein